MVMRLGRLINMAGNLAGVLTLMALLSACCANYTKADYAKNKFAPFYVDEISYSHAVMNTSPGSDSKAFSLGVVAALPELKKKLEAQFGINVNIDDAMAAMSKGIPPILSLIGHGPTGEYEWQNPAHHENTIVIRGMLATRETMTYSELQLHKWLFVCQQGHFLNRFHDISDCGGAMSSDEITKAFSTYDTLLDLAP